MLTECAVVRSSSNFVWFPVSVESLAYQEGKGLPPLPDEMAFMFADSRPNVEGSHQRVPPPAQSSSSRANPQRRVSSRHGQSSLETFSSDEGVLTQEAGATTESEELFIKLSCRRYQDDEVIPTTGEFNDRRWRNRRCALRYRG